MTNPSAPGLRPEAMAIDRLEAIRLLASPLRNDMVVTMLGAGSCSVTQLASWLNRPPSSLYFHMEKLEQAGLVRQVAVRRKERHEEALYATVATSLRIPQEPATDADRELRARVASVGLTRLAERIQDALSAGWAPLADGEPSVGSTRSAAWLDETELARFRELSQQLRELVATAGPPAPDKTPIHLALAYITHDVEGRQDDAAPV